MIATSSNAIVNIQSKSCATQFSLLPIISVALRFPKKFSIAELFGTRGCERI